jgi:hypothetical protein
VDVEKEKGRAELGGNGGGGMIRVSFEITPTVAGTFAPFLLDVPKFESDDIGVAARRAYFSAMAHLASKGYDVEDFAVRCFDETTMTAGQKVGPGGVIE